MRDASDGGNLGADHGNTQDGYDGLNISRLPAVGAQTSAHACEAERASKESFYWSKLDTRYTNKVVISYDKVFSVSGPRLYERVRPLSLLMPLHDLLHQTCLFALP